MTKQYKYFIQIKETDDKQVFNNANDAVRYINQYYNIDILTKDILNNYFYKKYKKIKAPFNNIFHLTRERYFPNSESTI